MQSAKVSLLDKQLQAYTITLKGVAEVMKEDDE